LVDGWRASRRRVAVTKVDVVVIGAGAAGLTTGALLAKNGKSVLVLDKSPHLGGRGMAVPDEGFKLNVGGHLLEDSGSGITKIFEYPASASVTAPSRATCPSGTDEEKWARSAIATRAARTS
jgi:phytoene dehydrogenase-like protein